MFSSLVPLIISVVVAVAGSGGIVFGALRYNRDEAGRVVTQQTAVLESMRGLNDELQSALDRVRLERDDLVKEVRDTRVDIAALRIEIHNLQAQLKVGGGK